MLKVIWHHMMADGDEYPHSYGKPTDCYCEPEVDVLSGEHELVSHRVVRHQDMTGRSIERREVRYG
jgi:hypothetical protein